MSHSGEQSSESWRAVVRFLKKCGITVREIDSVADPMIDDTWFYSFQSARISFRGMVVEYNDETQSDDLLHEGIHLLLGEQSTKDSEAHVLLPFEWAVVAHIANRLKCPEERGYFIDVCDSYQRGTIIYDRHKHNFMQLSRIDRYSAFWQRGLRLAVAMGLLEPDLKPTFKTATYTDQMRKILDEPWAPKPNQERMRRMMLIVPAYGRDYKSKAEIEQDLLGNKDFEISDISSSDDGRYINLPQMREAGIKEVRVRYKKLTMSCLINLDKMKPASPTARIPKEPKIKPFPVRSAETQSFIDTLGRVAGTDVEIVNDLIETAGPGLKDAAAKGPLLADVDYGGLEIRTWSEATSTGGVRNPPEDIGQPFSGRVILECRVDGKLCFDKPQPPVGSMDFDDVYKLYWKENPVGPPSTSWNELRAWLESKSWTVRACTWE